MPSTSYNYLDIFDGTPSGGGGVILNDNFSDISDLTLDAIQGLHTSNGTDANHDIDITAGSATDSTNAAVLVLASAITKRIDASWAVGSGNGGIDTGSVGSNTWYAIWLIKRSDTGAVDALFSTSFSSPTMPTNYDHKRYIGAVLTNGSANILAYSQKGDTFRFELFFDDLSDATPPTSFTTLRLSTPPILTLWDGSGYIKPSSGGAEKYMYMLPGDALSDTGGAFVVASYNANQWGHGRTLFWTNSSGQIKYRATHSSGFSYFIIRTYGWIDPRGRSVE